MSGFGNGCRGVAKTPVQMTPDDESKVFSDSSSAGDCVRLSTRFFSLRNAAIKYQKVLEHLEKLVEKHEIRGFDPHEK